MKQILGLLLLLAVCIMSLGCQTASTSSSTKVSVEGSALLCGAMISSSLVSDDRIKTSISSAGVRTTANLSDPVLGADNWWYSISDYAGATWYIYFQAKDTADTAILLDGNLSSSTIDFLSVYANVSMVIGSDSVTITMGSSKSSPMIFDGLLTTSKTINGPLSLAGTTSGTNYSISMNYNNIALNSSGYPLTGLINFTVTEGNSHTFAGTITFDGTNNAVMTYTSGSSCAYRVNLDSGVITLI